MIYNSDTLSFRILSVGLVTHEDGSFRVAGRPHAAFSYRLKGTGTFRIDGKTLDVKPGDIIFVPAGMSYQVDYRASESIVVHFLDCNYTTAEKISVGDREQLEKRFLRMLGAWQTHHSFNRTKGHVYDILSFLESATVTLPPDSDILACVQYMEENYTDPKVSVETICRLQHISHSSIQRRFKQYFGINPKQYLTKLRMNRALDMLTAGGETIKNVAYACGFEDEKYFSRVFRKAYGHSPQSLRNRLWI